MSSIKTILILSANPKDKARLRLDEEVREIEEGLKRSKNSTQFVIHQQWAIRLRDIRRAMLDYEPQIVHFCGHGEENGIIVEDVNGNAVVINPDALAGLFELFADSVECVLLNACYSEPQAQAINKYIKYVIGMSQGIHDKTAIEFAVGFYDALGAGKSIEKSFKFGCNAIQLHNIPEHLIPILKRQPTNQTKYDSTREIQQNVSISSEQSDSRYSLGNGKYIGDLNIPRGVHLAVKLRNGKVVILGGILNGKLLKHVEVFDPIQEMFMPAGSINIGRSHNGAVLLDNGTIYIAGDNGTPTHGEIYDPTTNTSRLTKTKSLSQHNSWFSMTLLPDGQVLLAGSGQSHWSRKTEIYDPLNDTFVQSFDLLSPRMVHTATLLKNGFVLIAGHSKRAELFDVNTGSSPVGDMCIARMHHTATLLPNGNVLVIGGRSVQKNHSLKEVEIFDARSGYFELTESMEFARWGHTATCLLDGRIVVIGGLAVSKNTDSIKTTDLIEIYDPHRNIFETIGRLHQARAFHSTTLLDDGSLLVVGGVKTENNFDIKNLLKTAEVVKFY